MTFYAQRGGVMLPVREGGPAAGTPTLLLHGFPQDASCWDAVAPLLHEGGLRTLAPHQRGYAVTARPTPTSAYDIEELVADALAVLDTAGSAQGHVVGHDWGGVLAWHLAARHPERVSAVTVLSTPHPAALAEAMSTSWQPLMSWYTLALQVPALPETLLARMLPTILRRSGLPEESVAAYCARLTRPSDLRGPLGWYRAAAHRALSRGPGLNPGDVDVPTTYLWGSRDPSLGRRAAERTRAHVRGPYRFIEIDEGHWLPERRPVEVAHAILGI